MSEREVVIDKMRLTYEGLFDVVELYKLIDRFFKEKGYDKRERHNSERITPEGKFIELELEPWKKITDYAMNVIKLRIVMSDVTEVVVKKDNVKVRLNKGKINMVFDAYIETDYEHRWEGKPLFFFLRTIFDKYVFRPYTSGFRKNVIDDCNHLYNKIKAFLNLYKIETPAQTAPRATDLTPGP